MHRGTRCKYFIQFIHKNIVHFDDLFTYVETQIRASYATKADQFIILRTLYYESDKLSYQQAVWQHLLYIVLLYHTAWGMHAFVLAAASYVRSHRKLLMRQRRRSG
jgi:hypothetical protein